MASESLPANTVARNAEFDKGWDQGVAYCVGILARLGEETHAGVLIAESGLTYNDFDRTDPYDRKEVRRIFRTEPRLREMYEARKR